MSRITQSQYEIRSISPNKLFDKFLYNKEYYYFITSKVSFQKDGINSIPFLFYTFIRQETKQTKDFEKQKKVSADAGTNVRTGKSGAGDGRTPPETAAQRDARSRRGARYYPIRRMQAPRAFSRPSIF